MASADELVEPTLQEYVLVADDEAGSSLHTTGSTMSLATTGTNMQLVPVAMVSLLQSLAVHTMSFGRGVVHMRKNPESTPLLLM